MTDISRRFFLTRAAAIAAIAAVPPQLMAMGEAEAPAVTIMSGAVGRHGTYYWSARPGSEIFDGLDRIVSMFIEGGADGPHFWQVSRRPDGTVSSTGDITMDGIAADGRHYVQRNGVRHYYEEVEG